MLEYAEVFLRPMTVFLSLLAVVYATGIVWRVERKLDVSYKFFLIAIISFMVAQVLEFFRFEGRIFVSVLIVSCNFIFSVFFLAGIWTMRDLLRVLDGEK